jgi:hypothetical protein
VARGQQQRALEQQQAGIMALRALQMRSTQLDMASKAIELQQAVQNKEYLVQRNHAFLQVGEMLKNMDLTDPQTDGMVLDALLRVPGVDRDPRLKAVMDTLEGAKRLKMQRELGTQRLEVQQERLDLQRELGGRRLEISEKGLELRERTAEESQAAAAERNKIALGNLEMRREELDARIKSVQGKLGAVDQKELGAKLQAVVNDITLFGKPDEQMKRIEQITEEFRQKATQGTTYRYVPGQGLVPK